MGLQDAKLGLQRIGQSAVNAVVSDKTLPNKEEVLERIDKKREDVNEKRDQYDGGGGAVHEVEDGAGPERQRARGGSRRILRRDHFDQVSTAGLGAPL